MGGKRGLRAILAVAATLAFSFCVLAQSPKTADTAATTAGAPLSAVEVATIQRLCETVSIQYARFLDEKDWRNLPSVFAENGVWEVLGNRMEGRGQIGAYWQRRTADWVEGHGRVHQISNQVITVIDRDHARGVSTAIVYFFDTRPAMNKSLMPSLIARNDDEFIRTAEGWKLLRRSVSRVADLAPQ